MHDNDDDDVGVTEDGGHTLNNRLTDTCNLGLLFIFFDIGHPCYDQLTPVAGSTLQLFEVKCFF